MAATAVVGRMTFHELLSELNPLQYLPVIGTIYRSLTGDTIPDSARIIGSMVVSGLIGGPIGVATNLAALAVEKVTGLDPEKIGHDMLASIGIGNEEPAAVIASTVPSDPVRGQTLPVLAPAAWSPLQLAAYGVTTTASGTLRCGELQGSDVLNDLELTRHGTQFADAQSEGG